MEHIWADLLKDEASLDIPNWHLQELEKTEEGIRAGKAHFEDWDVAKRAIREA
ncbi:MAG: addiction module protein [Verrucomicrobiota bacterium]